MDDCKYTARIEKHDAPDRPIKTADFGTACMNINAPFLPEMERLCVLRRYGSENAASFDEQKTRWKQYRFQKYALEAATTRQYVLNNCVRKQMPIMSGM